MLKIKILSLSRLLKIKPPCFDDIAPVCAVICDTWTQDMTSRTDGGSLPVWYGVTRKQLRERFTDETTHPSQIFMPSFAF